jgi:RNA polymerase sigma-70 factor, ECF subfamily
MSTITTHVRTPQHLADEFQDNRSYLLELAYRMLGSHADAEDAVQEAWLRLSRTNRATIDNLRAWLTTVTARICLDLLRTARARPEQPLEVVLADTTADPHAVDPSDAALLADQVTVALHVVLAALSPAERLAFVLHDLFAVPLDSIAALLDRSPTATKQLAHRARRRLRISETATASDGIPDPDRAVVDAFFAAARAGDFDALLALLHPAIQMRADGPSAVELVTGAEAVAGRAVMFARPDAALHPARVDGMVGVVITIERRPVSTMAFTVSEGQIRSIRALTDRNRLARLIPAWVG